MRKTSVYLTEDEAEGLRRLAVREGIPQAELIRQGIRHVLAGVDAPARTFRSLGKGHGGGRPYASWSAGDLHDKVMGER